MIITIICLAMLAWSYLIGQSRGLALQGFYTLGFLVALFVALKNYVSLGEKITLWVPFASATAESQLALYPSKLLFEIDHVFYALLAFVILFFIVYGLVRLIGLFLSGLESQLLFGSVGKIIAGVLSLMTTYFVLSIFVMILSTIPVAFVQNQLAASHLARFMIDGAPLMSGWLQETFITHITKIKI